MRVQPDDGLDSPVAKFLSDDELAGIRSALAAEAGDLVLLVADERHVVRHVLGLLRLELGRPPVTEGGLHFLWVVDFPLFEGLGDDGSPVPGPPPVHDAPPRRRRPADVRRPADLLQVRSQAYDLVLNGWELGSGSVRIHRSDVQQRIFGLLGHRRGGGAGEVRLPARRLPLRRAAARRLRRSASTGWSRCWSARRTSARSSPSPRPSRAPTRSPNAPTPIEPRYLDELGLRLLPRKA